MDIDALIKEIPPATQIALARTGQVFLTLLLMALGMYLVKIGARRMKARIEKREEASGRAARLLTLISLGSQIVRGVIVGVAAFTLLGTFGVNMGPILTSLGVVGLAVSLGAQTLIKDYFGGLMILVEDQYLVGDTVTIGAVTGVVEDLTLRLTRLRDVNGKLHMIPNGDVRLVTNASRDWALAMVDVNLEHESDLNAALKLLEAAVTCVADDPALAGALLDAPTVQGWNKLLDWAVQVRLSARTLPAQRVAVEIALRRCALEALQAAQIPLARPVAPDLRNR